MPTLPMKIGVPLDEMSVLFFASLGLSIWLVYIFCQHKFAERNFAASGDFVYQLLPQQLATRARLLARGEGGDGRMPSVQVLHRAVPDQGGRAHLPGQIS